MNHQIQFFVHATHAIGGVTTWAFQAANYLSSSYDANILTVVNNEDDIRNQHLFPGETTNVSTKFRHANNKRDKISRERKVRKTKRIKKARKTTKAVLPPKERKPSLTHHSTLDHLDASAEMAIEQGGLFIPNYIEFGYQLAAISRLRNQPSRCIGICHTDQDNYYYLLTRYEPVIQTFIAVSNRCAEKLRTLLPHREEDIHTVPYGVYLPTQLKRSRSSGQIRLLYTGRFAKHQKRILDFVEVIKGLEKRNIDYVFDLWGTGPDESELVSAVAGFSRVRVCQGVPHSHMFSLYPNYDIIVLASATEGTSISMLEGMAHGLVPIVTRVSGAEDVVSNGRNGFLVEVGDIDALSDRIAFLSRASATKVAMSKRAYETVEKSYRAEEQLRKFSGIIRKAMQKPMVSAEAASTCLT